MKAEVVVMQHRGLNCGVGNKKRDAEHNWQVKTNADREIKLKANQEI